LFVHDVRDAENVGKFKKEFDMLWKVNVGCDEIGEFVDFIPAIDGFDEEAGDGPTDADLLLIEAGELELAVM